MTAVAMPSVSSSPEAPFRLRTSHTYLAACSHSPLHEGMIAALRRYEKDLEEFGNPWDMWVERVGEGKALFGRLIGATVEEVAPNFSVSTALAGLLSAFHYEERKEIVVSDFEYPTTNHIFLAQRRYGARVRTLHHQNYRLDPSEYRKVTGPSTRLLSGIHVSSINGLRQDLGALREIAHSAGAEFYVDAYQSLGTLPLDVHREGIDYLAAGTLKYLLGIPGLAYLYVRQDLIPQLEPTVIGWFSQKDPFRFGPEELDFVSTADRFQTGTWPVPALYAGIAGMRIILDMGVTAISQRIATLTQYAVDRARDLGLATITPEEPSQRGAVVSLVVRDPHGFEDRLRQEGIITSSRGVGLRLAPHFYNTRDDLERALVRISELQKGG